MTSKNKIFILFYSVNVKSTGTTLKRVFILILLNDVHRKIMVAQGQHDHI